jgi:hypothetical protein
MLLLVSSDFYVILYVNIQSEPNRLQSGENAGFLDVIACGTHSNHWYLEC